MYKRSALTALFVIVTLSSTMICVSGCGASQSDAVDPNMLVAEEESISSLPADMKSRQDQAIAAYVDAMMFKDLNEREKALRMLNMAIELDPQMAVAYSLKGDILQDMRKYEASADSYEQATVYDPWSFHDFFNLGKVCRIIQQWARAANAYAGACKLNPQHYPAHLGAALCYYELKEYDNSLAYAQKAKTLDPDKADPELLLGDLFEMHRDHVQAINAYRRALELEGNNPAVMVSLARAYLRYGRYTSAKELLNGAIALDPESGMAHQYMGFAQLRLKETEAAIKSYQTAVQIDENDWMARKGLGVAYILLAEGMPSAEKQRLHALAVEQWNISLQIKQDQPGLLEWIKEYSY